MKILLYLLILPLVLSYSDKPVQTWVIQNNSSITIEGKSNINKFRCGIKNYNKPDTIFISTSDQQIKLTGGLEVNVNDFDCRHKQITKDLRRTLDAKNHPILKIKFLTLSNFAYTNSNKEVNGWVTIELAGITRTIKVDYLLKSAHPGNVQLWGSQNVQLSEFDLNCPDKLGGLIKVDDRITVNFQLNLKCLEE